MRALVISDKVESILYSAAIHRRVGEVDLILSCGDLPFYYIEYIVSVLNRPCYYVFGNHGREIEYQGGDWRPKTEPQGATNLHTKIMREGSLLMASRCGATLPSSSRACSITESATVVGSMYWWLTHRLGVSMMSKIGHIKGFLAF